MNGNRLLAKGMISRRDYTCIYRYFSHKFALFQKAKAYLWEKETRLMEEFKVSQYCHTYGFCVNHLFFTMRIIFAGLITLCLITDCMQGSQSEMPDV